MSRFGCAAAFTAALRGRLISGLITDERTAAAVLEGAGQA